jgi:hypothetical protein
MSLSPLPPSKQDNDNEGWQHVVEFSVDSDSRSLWVDGRFYIDLATGKLNLATLSESIVLAAANSTEQPILEDILKQIVENYQR